MKGGAKPKRLLTVNEKVELELNKGIEIGCNQTLYILTEVYYHVCLNCVPFVCNSSVIYIRKITLSLLKCNS